MVGQWCYIVVQFLQSLLYFFIFLLYTCTLVKSGDLYLSLYSRGLSFSSPAPRSLSLAFLLECWGFFQSLSVLQPLLLQLYPIGALLGWSINWKKENNTQWPFPIPLYSSYYPGSLGQRDRFSLRLLSILPQ